jgi:TP901-1 family phage major tail protein
MTAQKGKDFLLKVDDGASSFVTVAGLRTQRLALNTDSVDITHQESAGHWRELLTGAGVRRASLAGNGVFKDAASDAMIRQIFFDAMGRRWQIVIPSFGIIEGPFVSELLQVSALRKLLEAFGESLIRAVNL